MALLDNDLANASSAACALLPTLTGDCARRLPMGVTRTTGPALVGAIVGLASLGSSRNAASSPQSGTWLRPGGGAHLVAASNLATALVRARETGPSRLEWSGRSPVAHATRRQETARSAGARGTGGPRPAEAPGSATNGSSGSRTYLLDGRADDGRPRKRLPEARALLDPARGPSSVEPGSRTAMPGLRLMAGEAVFHDANAPPTAAQSLVGRLS